MRSIRRACVVALCIGALGTFASPRAGAHALLARADPADGASLSSPPKTVTLQFTETPDPRLSRIDVLDTSGTSHVEGVAQPVPPRGLRVKLGSLSTGVYTVSWRVVSRSDGHLTAGAYAFGVGVSPSQIEHTKITKTKIASVSWPEAAGRFLLYAGLIVLLGSAFMFGFAFTEQPPDAYKLADAAAGVAFVGLVVLAYAQDRSAGASLTQLLKTPIGHALLERAAGLVLAVIALSFTKRWRSAWYMVGFAAVATMFVHASAGHAAAGGIVWVKVIAQTVHIAAVGLWIGGLVALLAGLRGVSSDVRGRAARRFSTLAAFALLAVAGTGTERAIQEVGSWHALLSTGYGRVVIAKAALLCVLALLGAVNRYRNVGRAASDPSGLRRFGRIEIATAAVVLVLAGLLASMAPAKSSQAQGALPIVVLGTDFTQSVAVRLEIAPGQAGVNAFTASVDVKNGPPARGVRIRFVPVNANLEQTSITLHRSGDTFVGRGSAIALPGRWRAVVEVDRGADSVEIPLEFHTRCPDSTTQNVGGLRLQTIEMSGGRTVQAYVDPAKAGGNAVHFTFFDEKGNELPLGSTSLVTATMGTRTVELSPKRLGPGHVVGNGTLRTGRWLFEFDGSTKDGSVMSICFEDVIA